MSLTPSPLFWSLNIAVLAFAVALDLMLPEPPSWLHPVRWMGATVSGMEKLAPASGAAAQFLAGVVIAIAVPWVFSGAAWWVEHSLRGLGPVLYVLVCGALLKTTFAVRGLTKAGRETAALLAQGDLVGARTSLASLVSRDRSRLSAGQAAGAAIESVAENSTDSYIGPWLFFALFGLPGAFAYRAINTLDSMIGYRGHYEYLGKASARLDDAVNLLPARLSALLMLASGTLLRLPARRGWRTMVRDHARTTSPNAGWTMSAMAGLLGVRLEKDGHYTLGADFDEPLPANIHRAIRIVHLLAALGLAFAMALVLARHQWLV